MPLIAIRPKKKAPRDLETPFRYSYYSCFQDTSVPTASSEGAGAGADLLSTDLSPIAPPQNKRPRKLLGGGTSRCKTPKAKKTAAAAVAAAASSRVNGYDDDDDDGNDENAHPAAGALPPAGAGVTGVVAGAGVGPKSGSSAAAAKKAQELQRAPDSQAGEGAGSGSGGGGAAAKPAVKPLKVKGREVRRSVVLLLVRRAAGDRLLIQMCKRLQIFSAE